MKILLVDDEKEFVSTLAERLAFRDIQADWVTSAEEAMEMVKKNYYDIAVLDVKMPMISGIKLMQMIKEKVPGMRFIFLTGHSSESDFKEGSESGACFYLMKPLRVEVLVEKLNDALTCDAKRSDSV